MFQRAEELSVSDVYPSMLSMLHSLHWSVPFGIWMVHFAGKDGWGFHIFSWIDLYGFIYLDIWSKAVVNFTTSSERVLINKSVLKAVKDCANSVCQDYLSVLHVSLLTHWREAFGFWICNGTCGCRESNLGPLKKAHGAAQCGTTTLQPLVFFYVVGAMPYLIIKGYVLLRRMV